MGLLVVLILSVVLLLGELRARKLAGVEPASFSTFWWRLQKKKMAKGDPWPPLGFAFIASFSFALWEFFIRSLLNRDVGVWSFLFGIFAMVFLVSFRFQKWRSSRLQWTREEILLWLWGWVFVANSWMGALLTFWVGWRCRHLPFELFGLRIKR